LRGLSHGLVVEFVVFNQDDLLDSNTEAGCHLVMVRAESRPSKAAVATEHDGARKAARSEKPNDPAGQAGGIRARVGPGRCSEKPNDPPDKLNGITTYLAWTS
jgi:hypothetical protein